MIVPPLSNPRRKAVSALGVVPLAFSCAAYPERTAEAMHAFQGGHFERAIERFADEEVVGEAFLSGAEAGMVALVKGDWEQALEHLHRAADAAEEIEERALVGPEALAEGLSSWALNDTTQAYQGEGFERVYVHCALGLTYLALGKLEDAYVEARRSNRLLETEEKLYEKTYRAGGWGHLLSAVAYELLGEYDQAYVDYVRMEEKGVGTELAGPELVRLSTWLGRSDDRVRWEERYASVAAPPRDFANVVVLAGIGLGPFKTGGTIPVPTHSGIVSVSAATYRSRPQPVSGLRIVEDGGGPPVTTVLVERVSEVAEENLQDRLAWQVAKSVARGFLKRELTQKLEKEWGDGGRVVGDIFSFVSERPDLRAWLTLPDSWQAARLFVPAGVHRFTLEAIGGETVELGSFELEAGETMFVFARTVETRLFAHPIGGLRSIETAAGTGE